MINGTRHPRKSELKKALKFISGLFYAKLHSYPEPDSNPDEAQINS